MLCNVTVGVWCVYGRGITRWESEGVCRVAPEPNWNRMEASHLLYADDADLLAETEQELGVMGGCFDDVCTRKSLEQRFFFFLFLRDR